MKLAAFLSRAPKTDLAEWLYAHWFIGAPSVVSPHLEPAGDAAFVAELNARCDGAYTWQRGFAFDGTHFASDSRLRLFIADPRTQLRREGDEYAVRMPCAREGAMSHYFALISRAGENVGEEHKLYVNATPAGAVELMGGLLAAKELARVRFQAKTLNHPLLFSRRDTLLVYAEPEGAQQIARWLRSFVKRNPRAVRPALPPLVRAVTRGVGFAESPVHASESFGFHRCRLIAEAVLTSRRERRPWAECVAERFEREGLDWSLPWAGSAPA